MIGRLRACTVSYLTLTHRRRRGVQLSLPGGVKDDDSVYSRHDGQSLRSTLRRHEDLDFGLEYVCATKLDSDVISLDLTMTSP